MKKLLVVLMVLCTVASYAQAPRYWPTWMDGTGAMKNTSASAPMPVSTSITVGSVSVDVGAPPSVGSTTSKLVISTSSVITGISNRQDITLFYPTENGTETVWINPGGSVATPGLGIPLYPGGYWSREADAAMTIPVACSGSVTITVQQGGY